jgi:hypothetical protein
MKALCKCGKIAVWEYMPKSYVYKCDDCVPRGCSCNIQYSFDSNNELVPLLDDDGNYVEERDFEGRLVPCCEWCYDELGFDLD